MIIYKDLLNLSDPKVLKNYELEKYRQFDPPVTAYEMCEAYIPKKDFSERKVKLCFRKMLSEFDIDLTGISVREALTDLTYELQLATSWRWLVVEGLYGFLGMGLAPDIVEHPDIRRGYVLAYFMYLPKRGKIYEDTEFEKFLAESMPISNDLPNGTVLGLKYPYIDLPDPRDNKPNSTIYVSNSIHYAVVISQKFLRENQAIPVTQASTAPHNNATSTNNSSSNSNKSNTNNNSNSNNVNNNNIMTGRDLIKLTHAVPHSKTPKIDVNSFASRDSNAWKKMKNKKGEVSLYDGDIEVMSVYDPSTLTSSLFSGFKVGVLNDTTLGKIQQYYNDNRFSAIRILVDSNCNMFRYDAIAGKYYDAQGNELTDPSKQIDTPPYESEPDSEPEKSEDEEMEDNNDEPEDEEVATDEDNNEEDDETSDTNKPLEEAYDPGKHAGDYITLVFIS